MRSTQPGVLAGMELPESSATEVDPRHEGVFSLVLGSAEGMRKIPSLYFDKVMVYGHRDPETVAEQVAPFVAGVLESRDRSTYLVTQCEIEGKGGLYLREVHNRAAYRKRLERIGGRFADLPLVWLDEDGFTGPDGPFEPRFAVAGATEAVEEARGAMLPFTMSSLRLGGMERIELTRLVALLKGVPLLGAADPTRLVEAVQAL